MIHEEVFKFIIGQENKEKTIMYFITILLA